MCSVNVQQRQEPKTEWRYGAVNYYHTRSFHKSENFTNLNGSYSEQRGSTYELYYGLHVLFMLK